MKNTKAELIAKEVSFDTPDGLDTRVSIEFRCTLMLEDWQLLVDSKDYMNEHMSRDDDEADHMLALLTWSIHKAYEDRTGKPFVLRMDRPKN